MIPQHPDEVDADWLTARLQPVAPGVRVAGVEVLRAADATNFNATLRIRHDSDRLPETVFLKIPLIDAERRRRLDWASMGERETRFYRDLAPLLPMRVPSAFLAELDDSTGEFLLLLEHVDGDRSALADTAVGLAPELVERALGEFAVLHARYEHRAVRDAETPWLRPSGRTSDYGARLLRAGIESGSPLSAEFVAVAEAYIADRSRLQDAWELGPTTVLHGDAHIGNVFVDTTEASGRVGFFDWGLMTLGSPLRDVSYFLTMTLDPAQRAAHERELIDAYLAARREVGAAAIDPSDAWRWHRLQSAYTVVASCQAIDVPADASAGRRSFAAAFVARATRAVEDLDPLGALAGVR